MDVALFGAAAALVAGVIALVRTLHQGVDIESLDRRCEQASESLGDLRKSLIEEEANGERVLREHTNRIEALQDRMKRLEMGQAYGSFAGDQIASSRPLSATGTADAGLEHRVRNLEGRVGKFEREIDEKVKFTLEHAHSTSQRLELLADACGWAWTQESPRWRQRRFEGAER